MDDVRTLRIERLTKGGDGIAREPGEPVVFVPRTAPGDLVRARLEASARAADFRRATLVEVLEPGPGRREPPCSHAAECGGCQWQHVSDDAQDDAIRNLLREALRRVGKLDVADDVVARTRGLPSRLAYRQRVRVHLAPGPRFTLGFLRAGSHDVLPVPRCPVAEPELQDMTERIAARLSELHAAMGAIEGELQLDLPADGLALALLDMDRFVMSDRLERGLEVLAGACPQLRSAHAISARFGRGARHRAKLGPEHVEYRRGPLEDPQGFTAFASPGGFLQASRAGNALLVSRVLDAARSAGLPKGARALELFAGDGNFSLPLAAEGFEMIASDSDERAVRGATLAAAKDAPRLRGTLRVERADAAAHARRLADVGERFDLVVLDPPRSGARDACDVLPRLGARAIVYVSCDAATLARDIAMLTRAGYSLTRAEPLAIFPQAAHFETVALLER